MRACDSAKVLPLAPFLDFNYSTTASRFMSSLLSRTLGQVHAQDEGSSSGNRRTSGGGQARASPYSVSLALWKVQ